MSLESGTSTVLRIGDGVEIVPLLQELRVDGKPVELGARAFDVLLALIEAAGTVLSKDELMARVWPGRVVEENNLQVQIAALRRALADHRELIRTVTGRGYQFTGTVHSSTATPSSTSARTAHL